MRLTVLSVAYPFAPVGPDTVGGAEQILSALDRALVRAGHGSVIVGHADSEVAGTLVATQVPQGLITDAVRSEVRRRQQANIEAVVAGGEIDIIHLHGIDFHEYRLPRHVLALATLHLPPSWYPPAVWRTGGVQLQCVSETQLRSCPPGFRDLPVVENGVQAGSARAHARREFALALGRICPEKNLHVALDAGTLAGVPVLLGGAVYPYAEHERYFRADIEPRLSPERNKVGHRFLGPLPGARKRLLLRGARCLLLPTLAPETSSLVAMETLAEGTPVIAFPSGAIPEIVREGVTGFLVRSAEEMARAIRRAGEIDGAVCRREAGERFSETSMIDGYFALYRRLLERGTSISTSQRQEGSVLLA